MAELSLSGDIAPVHDPVLIRHGGKWHLYCTGDGIPVRVSDDLKSWRKAAPVFPDIPQWGKDAVPGVRNPWAPDICLHNGLYYLYYSLSTFGSQHSAIGLATSERPDADPWIDRGLVLQSRRGDPYNAIDPNAFSAPDGRFWMAFGSFWQGIYLVELDRQTGKRLPGTVPRRIAARPNGGTAIEAPFLLTKDGWIYLFVSVDFCCRGAKSTYKTVVGRTRDLEQPFLDKDGKRLLDGGGTLVCAGGPRWRGPGHPGLATDGKGQWIAVHAYDAKNNGVPTLRIAELRWQRGWPEAPDLIDTVPASPRLEGTWEHRVDTGAASMMAFEPDGTIDNSVPGPGNRR
ncbi:MAG: arabinan endo-1,5-alpha-L-arabinosidase, partial [Armatimonadaceae bacterium]